MTLCNIGVILFTMHRKLYRRRGQKPNTSGKLSIMVRVTPEEYAAIDRARGIWESRGEWLRKLVAEALKTQPQ